MSSHSHTFSIPFAKAKRSAISYYLLFSDIHNFRGYSFSIEYTTIICCAFPEMNLLECIKHSYHLAVPNVNPFECIQTLSILNTCNVIPVEGMKCYRLWRYQIISPLNASNVITFWILAMFFHVFTLCNYLLLPNM